MAWVPIPDLGQGLNLDGQPEELALGVSTAGQNMRYRTGFAERFRGMLSVYNTPLVTPYHITHYTVGTTRFVVYAGLQKTYVDDGTTQTDITNANNTGGIDNRWCGFVFNGVYIQNNGVDVPQYWGGNVASNLANLTAWPAGYLAGWMRPFGNKIIAGDITRGGVRERGTVLWSHTADPGTIPTSWDIADATKDAGDFPLAETNGTLIDAKALGDMNVIYKDDAIHYQQSIQSSAIFRHGRLPGDTGLLARGCVEIFPGGHVYLTPGFDVVIHSGQGPQSILEGRMRRWLRSNMDATFCQRSFLVGNPGTNEVLICFPSNGAVACNKALVWNWKDNTFGVRDLPNVTYGSSGQVTLSEVDTWTGAVGTWVDDTDIWSASDYAPNTPRVIFTRTAPGLAMFDASSKDIGVNFRAMIEFSGLAFGDPHRKKLCRGVQVGFDAPAGTVIYSQTGSAETAGGSITWADPVGMTVGTDIEAPSFTQEDYYLAQRFYSDVDATWRVRSCRMDVVPGGLY